MFISHPPLYSSSISASTRRQFPRSSSGAPTRIRFRAATANRAFRQHFQYLLQRNVAAVRKLVFHAIEGEKIVGPRSPAGASAATAARHFAPGRVQRGANRPRSGGASARMVLKAATPAITEDGRTDGGGLRPKATNLTPRRSAARAITRPSK